MRSVSLRLVDLERKPLIPLGFEGENEYMTINFDCKTVFDKHPTAVPTLAVTPPQGDSYPAVVVRDGDIVSWTVCDSDLVYPGEGELQLTFVDGTIIGKTYKARTKVLDSITPSGEAPTPIQNWLIQAAAALQALPTEVANSVAALMGAMVGVGETLDPDDDVTVNYDPTNNTLTIGVPHGRDGEDGHTPAIVANKVGKVATFYVDGVAIVQISDGQDADPTVLIDDTSTAQNRTWSAKKLDEEKSSLKTAINSTEDDVSEILEHETYSVDGDTSEYEPLTPSSTTSEARLRINGYGTAAISTPASSDVKAYPVVNGKTYKVVGRCDNTNDRPLLIVANDLPTDTFIAYANAFDYVLGTSSSATVEEKEYTALRTGYLYITSSSNDCGVWLKNTPTERKYHIDDVLQSVESIDKSIEQLDSKVFRTKVDSASAWVKTVPRNAESVAKVTNLANSVTLVRSVIGRNLANKDAVGDVITTATGTEKKGIQTILLPPGRYYINLGSMGAYTFVKKVENGLFGDTLYKDQFPMTLTIVDPNGGYFLVYASSVANLGDMSSLIIAKLLDTETSVSYEAYSEKTYTPEALTTNNYIEVSPNGFIEFVNGSNAAVSSTVQYTVSGKDDDTTTSKEFTVSPDGTKYLPMVKNDGSVVCARAIPKKVLFIGNSLTSGWQTFGEAATESSKDFASQFSSVVDDMVSSYSFSRIWATGFEQKGTLAEAQTWTTNNIDPSLSSDLDLIVVQLSENVVSNAGAVATFPTSSKWLMQHLRETCPNARVVWMGVWFDRGWVSTLLKNTAETGCEYIDIRPLYIPANIAAIGDVYKMDADYTKTYTVDSFVVDNGTIALTFTVDGTQYTATIPSYTSYTSSGTTSISVTGIYHVMDTYYASIHPSDEGFRCIANKMLYDLGIKDSKETIPAS